MASAEPRPHNGGMANESGKIQVTRADSSFIDAHGVEIRTYSWVPEHPHAVVQIAHGIGEHAKRYEHVAQALAANGFAVYADDHRGHGETGRIQTGGVLERLGKLGPGGLRAAEAAILQFSESIKQAHPDLPLTYLGHSWGSLMGQRILNRHPHEYAAVILSGSAYRVPGSMESGDLNKHHKHLGTTGFEWLSRDPEVARLFAADPLCFDADVLKLLGLRDGLRLFGKPAAGLDPNMPLLIVSGTNDPLSVGDSIRKLADAYRRRGLRDVTLRTYAGARHEIFNETNRDEVIADVVTWLIERFPSR